MLGPLRWSWQKITKSDAKLSEIYEFMNKTSGTFFPGNVIYDFEHKSFARQCSDVCKLW